MEEDVIAEDAEAEGGGEGDGDGEGDEVEEVPEEPKKVRSHETIARLAHQDPIHDHDSEMCSGLTDENQLKSFNALDDKRNEMYGIGVPVVVEAEDHPGGPCMRCEKVLKKGDNVIEVPEIPQPYCAPGCFTCNNCNEELCEFNYYTYEGDVYCGRCHAEFFMPRCAGCDELIFDPTYTVAEGRKWHLVHFCCWVCDMDLCEKQYAKDTDSNPCCLPCYNDKYAVMCGTCKKPITAGERAMRAGENSYHHDDACFRCVTCKDGLENKKCVQYNEELYCSGCYHKEHSPPCGRCGEAVRGEFVEVRGKRYMKTCFNCFECGTAFTREEKKGAYPVGDSLLCYTHALAERRKQIKAAKTKAAEDEKLASAASEKASADETAAVAAQANAAAAAIAEAEKQSLLIARNATETKAVEGGSIQPRACQKSFIRQGTRKVSAMPKMSRQASVALRAGAKEKAAAAKAVADAEAVLASGAADDDEDAEDTGAGGDSATGGAAARASTISEDPTTSAKVPQDPFDSLWAGFSIPMKFSKFVLVTPGREILEIGEFTLIEKKSSVKCYLILATDVAFICKMVDADCYELLCMPEQRNKVKGKLIKMDGVFAMKVKIGKSYTLKCTTEVGRSQWIGKLNAPIGFIPTKALG
jgi:prickle